MNIKLKIEKFKENWETYYLATSDEVQGLVAEWKTINETIKTAYGVAKVLIEERNKEFNLKWILDVNKLSEVSNSFYYSL